ncbi:MAG TPA: hypothetical protein VH189_15270 [Rhizomicrobium sp.]|nr:hypothetical protein [Rhizomicrobium sp.]
MTPLVAGIVLISVGLVVGALFLRDFSDNGFRLASRLAWRYASLVFFLALVGGPACRIAARLRADFVPPSGLSRRLVWGFCASYGVYLLSVFLPDVIRPSAGATLMVLFGGFVALIMALSVAPLTRLNHRPLVVKARRALLVTAAGYFWLCYSIMALARLSGPHRPDAFYDISLSVMVLGLLTRFADRWFSDHPVRSDTDGGQPEQTVSNLRQTSVSN